ncbi:MAG: hypothetical protein V4725_16085 [Bacteroidota bacterium]|nr:hypothetical protein [Ferruginibacter sp.]
METLNTQQEIILVTGTRFSTTQYNDKDLIDNSKSLSERERLQEACWNGMVQERLPEIFYPILDPQRIYLWQLKEGVHFFTLEMGEFPKEVDSYYSIDPYTFIPWLGQN